MDDDGSLATSFALEHLATPDGSWLPVVLTLFARDARCVWKIGCLDETGEPVVLDQRGALRPAGDRCDIGAFELEADQIGVVTCPGDCDEDGVVSVAELVALANVALVRESISACPGGDANEDGLLTIEELVLSVASAVRGCP